MKLNVIVFLDILILDTIFKKIIVVGDNLRNQDDIVLGNVVISRLLLKIKVINE